MPAHPFNGDTIVSMFECLSSGSIAIAGPTGSGKSSIFHGSQYVCDVVIADTGSLGHRRFHRGGGAITVIQHDVPMLSPIDQCIAEVKRCESEGRVWCLDSWSALESRQVAWLKPQVRNGNLDQQHHKRIVGEMRDLASILSLGHGFVLFNTGQGGYLPATADSPAIHIPRGTLTGYPALSGCSRGSETILARWTSVWIAFRGHVVPPSGESPGRTIPRGFILPTNDFRSAEARDYTPLKDGYYVLSGMGSRTDPDRVAAETHPFEPVNSDVCTIDKILDMIAAATPAAKKPRGKKAVPSTMPGPSVEPGEAA